MTMGVKSTIDVPRLYSLWHDRTLRTEEVAEMLGVTQSTLYSLARRHSLPRRSSPRAGSDDGTERTWRDPTPSEIERLKEEIFQRILARLRAGDCTRDDD